MTARRSTLCTKENTGEGEGTAAQGGNLRGAEQSEGTSGKKTTKMRTTADFGESRCEKREPRRGPFLTGGVQGERITARIKAGNSGYGGLDGGVQLGRNMGVRGSSIKDGYSRRGEVKRGGKCLPSGGTVRPLENSGLWATSFARRGVQKTKFVWCR